MQENSTDRLDRHGADGFSDGRAAGEGRPRRLQVWNRTRAKAEPLAEKGARLVDRKSRPRRGDILFTMVSTGADLEEVIFGAEGVIDGRAGPLPRIVVDCSSIGVEIVGGIRARITTWGRSSSPRRSPATAKW